MSLSRRSLITGLVSLVAAPAIVRASSLMPVKAMPPANWLDQAYSLTKTQIDRNLYADLTDVTRQAFVPRLYVKLYWSDPVLVSRLGR